MILIQSHKIVNETDNRNSLMRVTHILFRLGVLALLTVFSFHSLGEQDDLASSGDYQMILQEAMNKIWEDYTDHLAFREEVTRKGNTVVGDYDPSREDESWMLLSMDGTEPAEKEIEKYVKDKRKQAENVKKYPERSPLGVKTMVEPGSLELIDDQSERWLFAFTPTGEDQKMMRKMKGELSINKTGNYLEWMDVRSEKPFKANFVTKMKKFVMHYEFQSLDDGPVVPASFEFRIHIAVGGIDVADEHLFANYSDYKFVN